MGTIHLTLTGARAGLAGCMVNDDGRTWGAAPLPEGHTGAHYAYAPAAMTDGSDPRVCGDCVRAFAEAE